MKNYKVVICDTDVSFAIALMNYINRNKNLPFLAMVFSDSRQLQEYLVSHSADLLVMDEEIVWQEVTQIPMLRMRRRESAMQEEDKKTVYISKYSKASVLVTRMLEVLGREKPVAVHIQDGTSIAVYSPIGRCGKTALAERLCEYWNTQGSETREEGVRSIYLGMEEYGSGSGKDVMETVLYYLKQRSEKLAVQVKALAREYKGFAYIPSADCYQELRELNAEDMRWLLESIRGSGGYQYPVADIGSGSLADLNCLSVFDVIYLPYLQEASAQHRIEVFSNCRRLMYDWNAFAEKCYPIDAGRIPEKAEGIRELEERRWSGSLPNLNAWMESRRKGEE